ncbi:MAG: FxsA family protein [Deltaproteobacteria bacterium]|nr:MAG: FxsA family protein [Deltaproteobacteria bacterium]
MFIKLLVLITLLPIIEIYVLIESGRMIGVLPTVLLVILTGIAGSWLMRQQGFVLLTRVQRELANGQLPAGALLDGALIIAGGILLLTPGFCTDLLGVTMLLPLPRRLWRGWLQRWLTNQLASGRMVVRRF